MCRTSQAAATALLLLLPGVSAAQSVNMGTTFHALEARATRVTATFPDVVIEARRGEGRAVEALVRGRAGEVRGRLDVTPDTRRVRWQGAGANGRVSEFSLPDQASVSLDWAVFQLYALQADEGTGAAETQEVSGDAGTWDGHLRRSRQAMGRGVSAAQLVSRVERVDTEFPDIVVRAALDTHTRPKKPGARVDYSKFTATIVDARSGATRGFVRWFDTAQVLTWKIEGGSQGVVLPERLPGGWTFTPTMAWANVQGYQFATQATRTLQAVDPFAGVFRGLFDRLDATPVSQVARALAPLPALALGGVGVTAAPVVPDVPAFNGIWQRPWQFLGVGAALNETGCDYLHWLDGSVFRACCDMHDRCYETNGCTAGSWWWPFAGSWSCQRCNAQVVYCFCTASNPAYCGGAAVGSGGDGGASGGGCTSVAGGFCPIECQTCQAR
jgi:hypothetical protein